MRGTANLVKFVVNELLIEYARYNEHFTDDSGGSDPALSAIYKCLSAHPLGNVEIEEYWDKTEYFNIETDTSERSPNGKYVNPRYFENLDKNSGKHLAPADIDNFYLDGLGARYDLVPSGETTSSDLHKFLEAVYDAGADNTFVDWKGRLNTSLPDGAATFEYKEDFETISGVYEYLISSQRMYGYQFDASASIGDQVDDYLKNVKTQISSMYYLDVYSLQRQLEPAVQKLEREIDALSAGVGNYIGSTYSQYFEKSEDSRCYDDETGDYLYDWFVGNETYKYDRLYDCIKRLNSYVRQVGRSEGAAVLGLDGTIHNWAILNHLKNVVDSYDDDKTQLDDLINEIESYHAVGDENLEVELETLASYLQKTYDNRMQSLQQMLEEFKKRLDKCDSKYEDLVSRKDDYLLRMPP